MRCPRCGSRTRVDRTRHEEGYVIRDRQCKLHDGGCGYAFITQERQVTREWVEKIHYT